MIAVIVLAGPSPVMHGLDEKRPASLLPVCDRPALQHVIESLVAQGITTIETIVGHAPEEVEFELGNGDRWGCHIGYHLVAQPGRAYRSLRVIPSLKEQPWVLIHAERYPCLELSADDLSMPTLYSLPDDENEVASVWGGTVVLPPETDTDEWAGFNYFDLEDHLLRLVAKDAARMKEAPQWLDVSTPAHLLQSQRALLDGDLYGLVMHSAQRGEGVWIGRNATINDKAVLVPPIYIGPNSRVNRGARVGPHAVVGYDCVIDSRTTVTDALVMSGSYVGVALEVQHAIVEHNLLVNTELDSSIQVADSFLIGRMHRPYHRAWFLHGIQRVIAFVLAIPLLPVLLVLWLLGLLLPKYRMTRIRAVSLPVEGYFPFQVQAAYVGCVGDDAWSKHRPAGWSALFRQFIPGVIAVALGNSNFVGLPPRTVDQISMLHDDWRKLYLDGRTGLITEASVASIDPQDEMQLFLSETYYMAQRNAMYDFKLAVRYFIRLFLPAKRTTR